MEYGRLKPLEGVNGREPTAFTKKTIKELLAEEAINVEDVPLMRSAAAKPDPEPEPEAQEQPKVIIEDVEPASKKLPPLDYVAETPAKKPRSFFSRLLGK